MSSGCLKEYFHMKKGEFKAFQVEQTGDKSFQRRIVTKEIDQLPQGDVLIRVYYSSLNYKDALSATGNRGVTRNFPHTPGIDAAGEVVESLSPSFSPGDQVIVTSYDLGMNTAGGFGEYIRVPAQWVVPLPEKMSYKEAMAYGTAGLTAAISVYKLIENGVQPSHGCILVTGATGGVGSVAVRLLKQLGYEVTGASGKENGKEIGLALGADHMISREEAEDSSGKPLLKERWAGVIDTVGGSILATAIKSVQANGTITCCGNVASPDLPTSVFPFILRGVSLLGVDSQNFPMEQRKILWEKLAGEWNLDGFFENQINAPRSSFNTFKNYFHYQLSLPNEQVSFTSSGNYIIKVYNDYDEEQLTLTRRFSIYENKVGIGGNIKRSILSKYRADHQQVDIKLLVEGLEISDPYSDIKLAVVQNNNWYVAKTDLQPQFVSNNELIYEDPNENLYKGYNEFRVFDMKSLKYLQERVAKIFFEDTTYYIRLMDDDDKRFKVYMNDIDINGAYIVRNRDYDDHTVESDYARVYFYLPMPEPVTDGNLYVFGELTNWQISDKNKMVYNYQKHAYQLMLELKQGYYNYQYVFANPETDVFEPERVEGSHHETENDYLIYVYAKLFGDLHDRLVGFSIFNSEKDNDSILGH